jgi:hypothetical protein
MYMNEQCLNFAIKVVDPVSDWVLKSTPTAQAWVHESGSAGFLKRPKI